MTSAEGPSHAGPISERIVKPDALNMAKIGKMVAKTRRRTLDRDLQHRKQGPASKEMPIYWFWGA